MEVWAERRSRKRKEPPGTSLRHTCASLFELPGDIQRLIVEVYLPVWFRPVLRFVCRAFRDLLGPPRKQTPVFTIWVDCITAGYRASLVRWLFVRGPNPLTSFERNVDSRSIPCMGINLALRSAAKANDFDSVRWMVERCLPKPKIPFGVMKWAVLHQRTDMVLWVVERTPESPAMLVEARYIDAARRNDSEEVKRLMGVGSPSCAFFRAMGRWGRVELLGLFEGGGSHIAWYRQTSVAAAKYGRTDVLRWLSTHGIAFGEGTLEHAMRIGDPEVIQYVLPHAEREMCTGKRASWFAVDREDVAVLGQFMEHKIAIDWVHLVKTAAAKKSDVLLRFALERKHLYRSDEGRWRVLHSNGYHLSFGEKEAAEWMQDRLGALPSNLYNTSVENTNRFGGYY